MARHHGRHFHLVVCTPNDDVALNFELLQQRTCNTFEQFSVLVAYDLAVAAYFQSSTIADLFVYGPL
jgi:hypothetical protein